MSLIGKQLLNNTFVQDTDPNWIKINDVAVGNSPKYSNDIIRSNDVGKLLKDTLNNTKVVCIVYNWKTNLAYTKLGFDLSNKIDYTEANGYTTFILKSKIPLFYNQVIPQIPNKVPIAVSSIIKWDKNKFTNNFIPVGFNAYWLGLTEEYQYPSHLQIEEIFNAANKMNATVIRSHTLGMSSGSEKSLRQPQNKINNNAWESIDYSFLMAKKYNIKLVCPLLDCYYYYHGNYGDFCKDRGIDKTEFFTNKNCISDFKLYINIWLHHINIYTNVSIKDSPELFAIETGNEFNIRPDATSITVPPEAWLRDISNYIKSIDPNHLILHGTDEPLGQQNEFNIENLDIYTGHFYWNDYSRLSYGTQHAKDQNKPYIIGEYGSRFEEDWYQNIERIPNMCGSIVWSMYPHSNGNQLGVRIRHDDGNTIWYDLQDQSNTKLLLRITNHFRRMQKLSELNELKF